MRFVKLLLLIVCVSFFATAVLATLQTKPGNRIGAQNVPAAALTNQAVRATTTTTNGLTGGISVPGSVVILFREERELKKSLSADEFSAFMNALAEKKKASSFKEQFKPNEEKAIVIATKALLALRTDKLPKEEKAKNELIASLALDAALVGDKNENPALIAPFFSFLQEKGIGKDAALALIDKAASMREPGSFTQSRWLVESMIKTYAFKGEALEAALGKLEKLIRNEKKAPAVASVMVLNIVKQFKDKAEAELAKNLSY